jgi:hypothetical protein
MSHSRVALVLLFSLLPLPVLAADPPAAPAADAPVAARAVAEQAARPKALIPLYGATIALQGYDAYSTITGIRAGRPELNPMMKPIAGNPALFVTIKAGLAAATIASAEQMWKKGARREAIVMMILSSSVMTWVDVHNAAVLRGQR